MSCQEAQERLTELCRGSVEADPLAEQHADVCGDCGAWLEAQRTIQCGLRSFGEAMGGPPEALEAALRARFRGVASKPLRAVWAWAAAAALVIGIGLGAWLGQREPAEPIAGAPAQVDPTGDFLLLDYGRPTPSLTAGRLVRVTLPPTAPAWFGLPVAPAASQGIEAEVLLGEDGVAQAVRLVRVPGK